MDLWEWTKKCENLFHQRSSLQMRHLHLVLIQLLTVNLSPWPSQCLHNEPLTGLCMGAGMEVMYRSYGSTLSLIQSFYWSTHNKDKHLDLNMVPFLIKWPTRGEQMNDVGSLSYWKSECFVFTGIYIYPVYRFTQDPAWSHLKTGHSLW